MPAETPPLYEAEVIEGIETFAISELKKRLGDHSERYPASITRPKPGILRFAYNGDLETLSELRTITAVYRIVFFPVPRPRALLGHQHFHTLLRHIASILRQHPPNTFKTLHLDAAGSDSSVMKRLKAELALQTGLEVDNDAGDLLIRMRRPLDGSAGWDVLIRLTPRPLTTRAWRICNFEGALNAAVAHTMALLTNPGKEDVFLNIACGSGSVLIERLACSPAAQVIGCDISNEALSCAARNAAASACADKIGLTLADARALPFRNHCIDALCADLPFGQLVGSHDENVRLYPAILDEAARVAKPRAPFIILTHEIRLLESILSRTQSWVVEDILRITLRGLHPRLYRLRRV